MHRGSSPLRPDVSASIDSPSGKRSVTRNQCGAAGPKVEQAAGYFGDPTITV
jgi:hypothetical protein